MYHNKYHDQNTELHQPEIYQKISLKLLMKLTTLALQQVTLCNIQTFSWELKSHWKMQKTAPDSWVKRPIEWGQASFHEEKTKKTPTYN